MDSSLQISNHKNMPQQIVLGDQMIVPQPTVNFDHQKLVVSLNGSPIDYNQQTLTPDGLQISLGQTREGSMKVLVDYEKSLAFQAKVHENTYCIELAKSLDRGTNTAYHLTKRGPRNTSNTNSFNFEICEIIIKKIPLKPRCFQTVFSNLPSFKIMLLLENDAFFLQLLKYLCRLIFKVDFSQVDENTKQRISQSNQNTQKQGKNTQVRQKYEKTALKTQKQCKTSTFKKKLAEVYEGIRRSTSKFRFSYERINLILRIFNRQNKLYRFLQEINKQIVVEILKRDLSKVFNMDQEHYSSKKLPLQTKLRETILLRLILIIKTVHSSLGKSVVSFEVLKNGFLKNSQLSAWLHQNIEKILRERSNATKLVQLFKLIIQFSPQFLANLYQIMQMPLDFLIQQQILWIYETINRFYPSEEQEKQQHEVAYATLDDLNIICKTMIKEGTTSFNIGRVICKYICQSAPLLRLSEIEMLTFVCCTNIYSREKVIKYLFSYFRKFIRGLKASLKGSLKESVKETRKNKHHLLQIMQSIRNISQIQSIDLTIDSELIEDIQLILQTQKLGPKVGGQKVILKQKERNDCIRSAYLAMLKSVKVENSKQSQNSRIFADLAEL